MRCSMCGIERAFLSRKHPYTELKVALFNERTVTLKCIRSKPFRSGFLSCKHEACAPFGMRSSVFRWKAFPWPSFASIRRQYIEFFHDHVRIVWQTLESNDRPGGCLGRDLIVRAHTE